MVRVQVQAAEFAFTVAVDIESAPISAGYFLQDVDARLLDGSSIFRIVTSQIEVIQMGLRERNPDILPSIQHEPTTQTGLRHLQGTVSLARFAPGAVYHSFFVCMRDEPALDRGGARNPDGLGFAAFGQVIAGFETLQRVFIAHARGGLPEYLPTPLRLESLRRLDDQRN